MSQPIQHYIDTAHLAQQVPSAQADTSSEGDRYNGFTTSYTHTTFKFPDEHTLVRCACHEPGDMFSSSDSWVTYSRAGPDGTVLEQTTVS
jgi:hypothetical protein